MKQNGFSCIFLSTPLIANTLSSSKGVINWNKWGDAVQSADLEITWQFCGRQKECTMVSMPIAKEELSLNAESE